MAGITLADDRPSSIVSLAWVFDQLEANLGLCLNP